MSDIAEIKVSAIDQASSILATIKGKADELSKSADGVKSSWNGGLMDGFTKGPALAIVGSIGAIVAAVGGAGAYFYSLTKSVMEAQAGLKQMSEVTGATVEGLSAIRSVAKLTGIDMETVSGGLTKLAKSVETGGQSTTNALNAIGLSLKEMQGLKTDEQFMKVTRALDGYADGAGKTALAQMLLGKSGAQLLPLMKDINEVGELTVTTTAAQARQADDLEKNIKRLTIAKEAWKKVVGTALIPVLDDVVKVLLKMQTETNGTLSTAKGLAADGSIKSWAQNAVLAVAYVIDIFIGLKSVFTIVGSALAAFAASSIEILGGVGSAAVAIIKGDYASLPGIVKTTFAAIGTITSSASDDISKAWKPTLVTDRLRAQFAESANAVADAVEKPKKAITGLGKEAKTAGDEVDKLAKALADLALKRIQIAFEIKSDAAKEQLAGIEALFKRFGGAGLANAITVAQKAALDAFEANAKAKIENIKRDIEKFTAAAAAVDGAARDRALANAVAERSKLLDVEKELENVKNKNLAIDREAEARDSARIAGLVAGTETVRRAAEDYTIALNEARIARDLELSLIGRTTLEQSLLTAAAAAEKEIRATTLELSRLQIDAEREMTIEQRQINTLEQERLRTKLQMIPVEKELIAVNIEVKKVEEDRAAATKSAGEYAANFFVDWATHGKSAFASVWKDAQKFFADLAAKLLVKYILNIDLLTGSGGGGGIGSVLGSIFSAGSGGGAASGGAASGGSLASSALSIGASVLGSVGTLGGVIGMGGSGFLGSMAAGYSLGAAGAAAGGIAGATGAVGLAAGAGGVAGVAGGIGAIGGVVSAVLAAIPVVGWIALAAAALYGIFGHDNQPGFKIDNNLTNVGNPASHFTSSAISPFDYSGRGTDGAQVQASLKPLTTAIQAIDDLLANKLLGAETLAKVRANINSINNESNWNNLDKEGIEKGTKLFLMKRYGAIFDEVDVKMAATIRGFTGTSEQLLQFIGSVVSVMQVLKDNAVYFKSVIGETISLSQLSALAKEGETLTQTLTRVVTVFQVTNGVAALMGKDTATAFGAVGVASLAARQHLIDLAGGINALDAMTKSYYDKYFSESERAAIKLKNDTAAIKATFDALGIATPKSTAEFRALVEAQDLGTEAGRTLWTALMKIADAFFSVNGAAESAVAAVKDVVTALYGTTPTSRDAMQELPPGFVIYPQYRGPNVKGPAIDTPDPRIARAATLSDLSPGLASVLASLSKPPKPVSRDSVDLVDTERLNLIRARNELEGTAPIVARMLQQQTNSVLAAYTQQQNGLQDLLNIAPRSATALSSLSTGMLGMRDAAVQLLLQIQQVKTSIGNMFGNTIETLKLSTMTRDEKYRYYQEDAEKARALALTSKDPLEIQRLAERVNRDVLAAQGLLTPEENAQTNAEQIANLEKFNKDVQDWLDKQSKNTADAFDNFLEQLGKKFDDVINAQKDTGDKQKSAADTMLVAANTRHGVDITFTSDIPGTATVTEVGG